MSACFQRNHLEKTIIPARRAFPDARAPGGAKLMAQYHVHFIDHTNGAFDAVVLEDDTEQAAVEHARRLHLPSIGSGFDVLYEGRLLYRYREN